MPLASSSLQRSSPVVAIAVAVAAVVVAIVVADVGGGARVLVEALLVAMGFVMMIIVLTVMTIMTHSWG